MQDTYMLFNPNNSYATAIMQCAYKSRGWRPLVVWSTHREGVFWHQNLPELQTANILEEFYIDQADPADIVTRLGQRYRIHGVVAYAEQTLLAAAAFAELLQIRWNPPSLLRRFRDKHALKNYLRQHHPHIPMNTSRVVSSVADVLQEPLPQRFVIKPNDGFANRDVGFFSAATPREELAAYFAQGGADASRRYVLEDFLEGPEFAVNGQMDHEGKALILNITRYERTAGNGKPNLYRFCFHVRRSEPEFAPLAQYAIQVMEATGLVRCPFHMELMWTPNGPRLIEVAARFGGLDYVYITQAVHGGSVDPFALATHYWLSDTPYSGAVANWEAYDRISFLQLDGVSSRTGRVYRLEGVDRIEALPEFRAWVFKPHVGQWVRRTVDLYSIPYSFQMMAHVPLAELKDKALAAEKMLRINHQVGMLRRLRIDVRENVRRVVTRLRSIA